MVNGANLSLGWLFELRNSNVLTFEEMKFQRYSGRWENKKFKDSKQQACKSKWLYPASKSISQLCSAEGLTGDIVHQCDVDCVCGRGTESLTGVCRLECMKRDVASDREQRGGGDAQIIKQNW